MELPPFPFELVDWASVERVEHAGASGIAHWRTRSFGPVRVRVVEYSAGYVADHWCAKGHILLCLEGAMDTELGDGRVVHLEKGESYQVGDGAQPHRTSSRDGATLFIVD